MQIARKLLGKKLSAIKAKMGEKSNPPIGGKKILNGLNNLSDICLINTMAEMKIITCYEAQDDSTK